MLEVKDATIAVEGKVLAKGLSFMVENGQLTCVTGSSGSGKTTLLRTLMGFVPVAEGFVSVDGELLTVNSARAFRSMMTYLPQEIQSLGHQLNAPQTPLCEAEDYGVWNALLPAVAPEPQPSPLSPEEIFLLAQQTLQHTGDKTIVIADEPAAHLTPELTLRLMELIEQQVAAGKAVLVASRRAEIVSRAHQVINLDLIER